MQPTAGWCVALGFFEFLFATIIFVTLGSVGVTYLAGRAVWRGGKKLLGMARERKQLTEGRPPDPQEAQDVVVEYTYESDEPTPHRKTGLDAAPRTGEGIKPGEGTRIDPAARASVSARPSDYVHLDVDKGCTEEDIIRVMRGYVSDGVVGERASAVNLTLEGLRRRKQSLSAELDATFQPRSLSWERFAAPIQAAFDAILRNAALLANRIQAFDTAGYVRLFKSVQRDSMGEHAGSESRAERLRLYQDMLASLDALQETNDGLVFELDKLAGQLADVQRSEDKGAESATLDEIRRLVDEAKYYRSH